MKQWSNSEIVSAMEANMQFHMTYFARYVSALTLNENPDVTMVSSEIPDDTFNYVLNAKFSAEDVKARVRYVVDHYRSRAIPFSWWIGENDTPKNLETELEVNGLSLKKDDIGMYLSLESDGAELKSSQITMSRVSDQQGLQAFAKVFVGIGGYSKIYQDLYSKIPLDLITKGAPFELYVGYLNGKPVVTGVLVFHADVAGIYYVMTVPEQRRKGFGTYVMQYLICRAQEKGVQIVTLQASADGRGLYERLGFQSLCRFVEYA